MNNLRELRTSKKIKASALADALCVTPKHYYDLETGKRRLNTDHLLILSKELGVTATEVLAENICIDEFASKTERARIFANNSDNIPYIVLSEKAKEKGLSAETLEKLIDLWASK